MCFIWWIIFEARKNKCYMIIVYFTSHLIWRASICQLRNLHFQNSFYTRGDIVGCLRGVGPLKPHVYSRGGTRILERRMLPFLHVGVCMLSAFGKCMALLWQLFLVVGPDYMLMRSFLSRVRSITTDFGTERLLSNLGDVFHSFCRSVGISIPLGALVGTRIFPRALHAPGWRHSCDGIIKRSLSCGCKWFPWFLDRLKNVISFLRESMSDISEELCLNGKSQLADVLGSVSLENFAKWRWCTCYAVVSSLSDIWDTFCLVFPTLQFVRKLKANASRIPKVRSAVFDEDFTRHLAFVYWFTKHMTRLLNWAGSCICHQAEFLAGKSVSCDRKGRLLPIASTYLDESLRCMLDEGNAFTSYTFNNCSDEVLASYQSCARLGYATGKVKFEYLNLPPYSFARLGQPGVQQSILKFWNSKPLDHHHVATIEVMSEGSPSRSVFDALGDTISDTIPEPLGGLCNSVKDIPLDDNICEGPHAAAKRWGEQTRAASFPWIASCVRLEQNLADVNNIALVSNDDDLQRVWSSYQQVLQVKTRADYRNRPKRMSRKKLLAAVYRLPTMIHSVDADEDMVFYNGIDDPLNIRIILQAICVCELNEYEVYVHAFIVSYM